MVNRKIATWQSSAGRVARCVTGAAVSLLALGGPSVPQARGHCEANKATKLIASDAGVYDAYFGHAVSMSGDVAVIGAPWDNLPAKQNSGSAYVYRFDGSGWIEEAKLTASDAGPWEYFGTSVSISGDVAVIGAYADDNGSGSAYVFRFDGSGWIEEAKLTASDGLPGDFFGISVSISGEMAVIGAWGDEDAGPISGSAYVFRFDGSGWIEEAKLTASDAAAGDFFGYSLSISGDVVVIGAPSNDDAGSASGSAYVYRFDGGGWIEEAKLTASDATAGDLFGSVSVNGDLAVIGASGDDDGGTYSGSAYVFRFEGTGWKEEAKLTASDASADARFGNSVSISADVVVVGAVFDDEEATQSGSAYVYRFDPDSSDWNEQAKLTAFDAEGMEHFGNAVSISGDAAVIGARFDDAACPGDGSCHSGSAYAFRGLSDCNGDGTLDLCDVGKDSNGNGIPDECECPWDLDGSRGVGIEDFLALLAAWDTDPGGPPDFDGDGNVGITDFLELLANWGPCL